MSINKNSQNLQLDIKRHSFAHLMAAAVGQMFPETQFGVGPVIENGCYYDFVLPRTLIPEDLPLLEAKIKEMLKQPLAFKVQEVELNEAILLFEKMNQPLKVELLENLRDRGTTSMSQEERADFEGNQDIAFALSEIEKQAKLDNVHLTTEVYVINNQGELFGQKRSNNRRLFPSAWDVPGGHMDEGEGVYDCIVRELKEETNWDLDSILGLIGTEDWQVKPQSRKEGDNPNKRMVKVLVKVKNVENLILESDKVTEGKWFNRNDLSRLGEGRANEEDMWRINSFEEVFNYYDKLNLPKITIYRLENEKTGEDLFVDLCKGPHVLEKEGFREMRSLGFKLDKFSGSYWRGDQERNIQMQRIYALVFETKEELKDFIDKREEAKKRDHRILNETQKYYTISDLVGSGLPLFQPKLASVRRILESYLWQINKKRGSVQVITPHIAKKDLYQTSGHWDKFGDELLKVKGQYDDFCMKPMNCPHHMQIFKDQQWSYKDLPVRYFEPATVYRDEKPGQLSGLTRVRSITQDDGHLFCRLDQITDEAVIVSQIITEFYETIEMREGYWVSLSVRDPNTPEKYLGTDENWKLAEDALENAAKKEDLNYKRVEGEAAFYGPKLDFMFKDSLGREWQLATIQCDFNLPERFQLEYTDEKGEKQRPVVIHRAISGSLERFLGVYIEHVSGRFPFWLAPTQIKILTINDQVLDYMEKVKEILNDTVLMKPLKYNEIRYEIDDRNESLGKKIREATNQKVPVILIVGPKDVEAGEVSVRTQEGESKVRLEGLGEYLKNLG